MQPDYLKGASITVRMTVRDVCDGDRKKMAEVHQVGLDSLNSLGVDMGWEGVSITRYGFSARRGLVLITGVAGTRPAVLDDVKAVAEKRRAACSISG